MAGAASSSAGGVMADPARPAAGSGQAPTFGTPAALHQLALQTSAWAQQATALKATAVAGHFAVDPQSGQAFVDAYDRALNRVRAFSYHIVNITHTYMIGSSPGAQRIAPWNLQVAQELKTVISQLDDIYTNARDAHVQAIKNYQNTEHAVTSALQRAGRT